MYSFKKEDILAPNSKIPICGRPWSARLIRKLKEPTLWAVLFLLLTIGTAAFFIPRDKEAIAVVFDGERVAVVAEASLAEGAYALAKEEVAKQVDGQIVWQNDLQTEQVKVAKDTELADKVELYAVLKKELSFDVMATAIVVDEEQKVVLRDKETAELVLEQVKAQYLPEDADIEVEKISFEQEPKLKPVEAVPDEIVEVEEAFNLLSTGNKVIKTHEVRKGDSLWAVARANDLWVEEVLQANPSLSEGSRLQPGTKIKLVKAQPMLDVTITYKTKAVEQVPYSVEVTKDDSLWRGQERVSQWGQYGEKEMTYRVVQRNGQEIDREVLDEQVNKEPQRKIVRRGTKVMVASRGSGGQGELGWPLRGVITSRYGRRGGEYHTGLDIDGKTGDLVLAAGDGTVISAGWKGNYGYMVIIDHGDGLQTRYAHNSKLKVKVGDKVSRGEVVSLVGNTGRSTGSHLHFEVLVNGDSRNPSRYLD